MRSLAETYEPLIGQRIAGLAWRPITSDTPGVVSDLEKSSIEFSGAASIFFEGGGEILLTWMSGANGDCHLVAADFTAWKPFATDLVHCSPEEPWTQFIGKRLKQVSLFRDSIVPGEIVAARHDFESDALDLWVGVGADKKVHEGDDLIVCVGPPENAAELELMQTIGRQ